MKLLYRAWLVSFLVGFTSLALEIVWLRVMSFSEGNSPQVLSLVLGLYLFGIVVGAWMGRYLTKSDELVSIRERAAVMMAISAAVDIVSPLLLIWSGTSVWTHPLMVLLILLTSSTKAAMFPVVHHLGSKAGQKDTGRSLSKVYFFNILGSTFGPLLVGFWAFDWASSQQLMFGMAILVVAISFLLWPKPLCRWIPAWILAFTGAVCIFWPDPHSMMKSLAVNTEPQQIDFFSENRYGLIHTVRNPELGDTIFGGNVYDGRLNTDPVLNSNRIDRLLLISGFHAEAKRVLVIGLSGGAWVRVLMEFPQVQRIDVIELNPAYLDVVRQTPGISQLLHDTRVHVHIDDGRRWLKRYSGAPYDLIVMNTTFHWRTHVSNLLSTEFFLLVKRHLAPKGLLAFNSTDSPDSLYTADSVFLHAYRREKSNFVYAGEWDFSKKYIDPRLIEIVFKQLEEDRTTDAARSKAVQFLVNSKWISSDEQQQLLRRPLERITDQNMLTEFKYGRSQ